MRNLYEVLEVRPDADPEVVAAAFRALSKLYHPDVNKSADANMVMTEINHAFEILNDSAARAEYDKLISSQQATLQSAQTAPFRESELHPDEAPANGQAQKKTSDPEVCGRSMDGRFIAYSDATVLDTKTNLMWAAKDNGTDIDWQGAQKYCENYQGGGYTDWRMPTQDELADLYESTLMDKDQVLKTDLTELSDCCPWASATRDSKAARFVLRSGRGYWDSQSLHRRAVPVRSGK